MSMMRQVQKDKDQRILDRADAERFRWLIDGNGYFMEEAHLCSYLSSDQDKAEARAAIDKMIEEDR
jgi:hypothetical protein